MVSALWEELPLWVVQQMTRHHRDCNEDLLIARAELGDVQTVCWLLQQGCPASQEAAEAAAAQGNVAVLDVLQEHGCLLDEGICCAAARAGACWHATAVASYHVKRGTSCSGLP
jgi:hypothetical protein